MFKWWPVFEPWPRSPRLRKAINVGFPFAGAAVLGIMIVGPSLTWLAVVILVALCAVLFSALVAERPKRRRGRTMRN